MNGTFVSFKNSSLNCQVGEPGKTRLHHWSLLTVGNSAIKNKEWSNFVAFSFVCFILSYVIISGGALVTTLGALVTILDAVINGGTETTLG